MKTALLVVLLALVFSLIIAMLQSGDKGLDKTYNTNIYQPLKGQN